MPFPDFVGDILRRCRLRDLNNAESGRYARRGVSVWTLAVREEVVGRSIRENVGSLQSQPQALKLEITFEFI